MSALGWIVAIVAAIAGALGMRAWTGRRKAADRRDLEEAQASEAREVEAAWADEAQAVAKVEAERDAALAAPPSERRRTALEIARRVNRGGKQKGSP